MNENATGKIPTPEEPPAPTESPTTEVATASPAQPADAKPTTDAKSEAPPSDAPEAQPGEPPVEERAVPPTPPPVPPADAPKRSTRLVRSKSDRMIGGVCAGLAKVLNIDPLILRLALVLATVLGFGAGVVLYIACWILMPEGD